MTKLVEKHLLKNNKGRGKLTILFSPEQMAAIEANMLNAVPGTNVNSNRTVGETAKRAGVEATRTKLRENYKKDKRRNVGEMHTYVASKERQDPITGEPIITETIDVGSNGSGAISGRDPLLGTMFDLYTGTKAWNNGTKLLLWGAGKYLPSTMLGLWGRTGIINDVARRSFNPGGWGQVAARPAEGTSLFYKGKPQSENGLISLKFFERKPSRISEAEKLGVPKGERNLPFKEKQLTRHVQGEEAVKMFKEYGGEPIPEGSINGELLRKYVAEARERYGLTNNKNITDEEIAQALYKHSKELGGNTAAVNSQGEPQLLFRGDTRRYTLLKERMSPEELAKKSGTMDNSLGNLFLGEFPDSYRGVDRYIGTWRNFNGSPKLVGSGTGSKVVWDGKTASEIEGYPYLGPLAGGGYKLYSQPHRYGNIDVYKLPASMMESGVNDLNAFIVRTPQMRNASSEISVLNDDWMLQGAKDSHFMSKNYKYNPKTYSMENVKTGESLGEITTESAPESRIAMGDHYKELLKEAEQKQLGLLKSEANSPLRDEHSLYSYFALPNFNIQGAKHLLPYDLRIPRNWKDKNIYRGLIPLTTGYTLYNIFNQPQLQYLKQGGKMNTLLFLKNGSGIHIKKKNRGKFTSYCGGKVTNACIQRAKASGNPTLVKRATFALNARKWKHSEGGNLHKWSSNFGRTVDSNPNLDNMKGDYVSKKKSKYLEGGNIVDNFRKNYPTASKVALFIPFIGTALDGYDVIAKGDYSKTPEFLIGLAGDLTGYGAISKALKARKAYKALLTTKLINPSSVSMPVLKQAMLGTNKATTRAISATTTDVLGHAFNFKNGGRI